MTASFDESDFWIIDRSASISPTAVIGAAFRPLMEGEVSSVSKTRIHDSVHVGHFCTVGLGTELHRGVILDDYAKIEVGVTIGEGSLIIYRATVCAETRVGSGCVIGGFVTERSVIGDNSRIFGELIHRHTKMDLGWDADAAREESPRIGKGVFIGFGARIVGAVSVGDGSYVCAGAMVTQDLPAGSYVSPDGQISKRRT